MTNAVKLDDMRPRNVARYLVSSLRCEAALNELIRLAGDRQSRTADPHETLVLNSAAADLTAQGAMVHAKRLAFLNELIAIKPPTQDQVDKMIALAKIIDEHTAANITAAAIIASGTAILDLWAKTSA